MIYCTYHKFPPLHIPKIFSFAKSFLTTNFCLFNRTFCMNHAFHQERMRYRIIPGINASLSDANGHALRGGISCQHKFYRGLVISFDPSSIFNDPGTVTLGKRIHYIRVLFIKKRTLTGIICCTIEWKCSILWFLMIKVFEGQKRDYAF